MKRLVIVLFLLGSMVVPRVEARQAPDEPTVFLYLQLMSVDRTPIDDPEEVPDWLAGYLFSVQTKLIVENEWPKFVIESPEILGEVASSFVGAAADYDNIFDEAPFRALSINIQQIGDIYSLSVTPFSPYPYEPLPMGSFGWTSIFSISDNTLPDYMVELTVGEALYVADNCEGALSHLTPMRETYEVIDSEVLVYGAVRFYEANCRYVGGEVDVAAKLFEEILAEGQRSRDPDSNFDERWFADTAATNLAAIYIEAGQVAKARTILDDFQGLDTELMSITEREYRRYLERADLYLALDEPEKAIGELDELLEVVEASGSALNESVAWLYTERGYRYEQIGNDAAALADYEHAIEIAPTYPVAYYRRGIMSSGDVATADLAMFLELAPDFVSLHHPSIDALIEDAEARVE